MSYLNSLVGLQLSAHIALSEDAIALLTDFMSRFKPWLENYRSSHEESPAKDEEEVI